MPPGEQTQQSQAAINPATYPNDCQPSDTVRLDRINFDLFERCDSLNTCICHNGTGHSLTGCLLTNDWSEVLFPDPSTDSMWVNISANIVTGHFQETLSRTPMMLPWQGKLSHHNIQIWFQSGLLSPESKGCQSQNTPGPAAKWTKRSTTWSSWVLKKNCFLAYALWASNWAFLEILLNACWDLAVELFISVMVMVVEWAGGDTWHWSTHFVYIQFVFITTPTGKFDYGYHIGYHMVTKWGQLK